MISANGGLPAHRYTPQVTPRWPRGSEPASAGVPLGPIDLAASVNSLQQNLVQHNQILGAMKNAFDEQMGVMQHTHAQELQQLQHEQQRLHQDNINLHHRLGASPGTSSSTALGSDCPSFGSEDGGADMKIGLHEFHTWRVQAMAWYSECTMTVSAKNVHAFTKLKGRAAHVVTAKLSLDQLRHDQGFPMLLEVLEWAYGGDSADNILQAVTDLLDCRKGDRDIHKHICGALLRISVLVLRFVFD